MRSAHNYHAYLLRLTRARDDTPWEMVVKDVETGNEYPLADPDALLAFLAARVPAFASITLRRDAGHARK